MSPTSVPPDLNNSQLDSIVRRLQSNDPSLAYVGLNGLNIGDRGAATISSALLGNSVATVLNLGYDDLSDDGAKCIGKLLEAGRTALEEVKLEKNRVGDGGAYWLSVGVRSGKSLRLLHLGGNSVGPVGASSLSDAIGEGALKELWLYWNSVGPDGAMALGRGLARTTTLTALDVGSNAIGPAGGEALAGALRTNASLLELKLGLNNMGDRAAVAFASALRSNFTLQKLDLDNNGIGAVGGEALADALRANHTLMYLLLTNNHIRPSDERRIGELIDCNKLGPDEARSKKAEMFGSTGEPVQEGRDVMERVFEAPTLDPCPIPPAYLEEVTKCFSASRMLGFGAHSEVFEAADRILRKKFVVKRLKKEILEGDDEGLLRSARKYFQREYETMRQMKHPNICRLYAYSLSASLRGQQYLVLELARKGSLETFLNDVGQRKRLHWTTRIRIAHDAARALNFLHRGEAGQICLHGDVKSANVVLKNDFMALLIDCGLSSMRPVQDSDTTMSVMRTSGTTVVRGTPGYICPHYGESMLFGRRETFGSSHEVYALGIIFAELCTGLRQGSVTDDGTEVNHFFRYSKDGMDGRDLVDDADVHAGVWEKRYLEELAALTVACIAKNPTQRPTILEIEERLKRLVSASKPWEPGTLNKISFLFSDPLVWYESNGDAWPVYPRLKPLQEYSVISQCVKESRRDIAITCEVARLDRLQKLCTERCGCLHFSGHGLGEEGNSSLLFEDLKGGAFIFSAEELGTLLNNPEPFKFVFVSACHSELVGQAFVGAGVKHVVCCEQKSELQNDAAMTFAASFYTALIEGYTVQASFDKGKGSVNVGHSVDESEKYILLPRGFNHEVPVLDAEKSLWEKEELSEIPPIPPPPVDFIGREREMHKIVYALLSGERLVTIIGEKGLGRSTLASAVGHYIGERLKAIGNIDAILFVQRDWEMKDLDGGLLRPLYDKLQTAKLTVRCHGEEDVKDRICKALYNAKVLVIFAGTDGVEQDAQHFLSKLFHETSTVQVLLTSQSEMKFTSTSVVGKESVRLHALDGESAARLFGRMCQHANTRDERDLLESLFLSEYWAPGADASEFISDSAQPIVRTVKKGMPSEIIDAATSISEGDFEQLLESSSSLNFSFRNLPTD